MRTRFIFFTIVVLSAIPSTWATTRNTPSTFAHAPKLSFRTINGMLMNSGTRGGSLLSIGGLNLQFLYFPNPTLALGGGYLANFDFEKGSVPINGPFMSSRWYPAGNGTRTFHDLDGIRSERLTALAYYGGLDLALSNYYLGSNKSKTTDEIVGSFFNLNAALGLDIKLDAHFEINLEGNVGLLVFSSSDDRYRIKGIVSNLGITYLW